MTTMDVHGRWPAWYMKCKYGCITLTAYLRLGLTLGAVQVRHSLRLRHVALYLWLRAMALLLCMWWMQLWSACVRSIHDCHTSSMAVVRDDSAGEAEKDTVDEVNVARDGNSNGSDNGRCGGVGVADTTTLLSSLPSLLDTLAWLVQMTHGESVQVRLRALLQRQAQALQAHGGAACSRRSNSHHNGSNNAYEDSDAPPHDALFVLAASDATYAATRAAGAPVHITYAEAVMLVALLSQVVAWELFLLQHGRNNSSDDDTQEQGSGDEAVAAAPATAETAAAATAADEHSAAAAVQPTCVALMMPNTVEYNLVWLSCVGAGPLHTFLDVLYSSDTDSNATTAASSYRPCRVALINTNVANNSMLHHALACAGSAVVVLDVQYVHLLFADNATTAATATGDDKGTGHVAQLRLHVPACVRRIFVWRTRDKEAVVTASASLSPQEQSQTAAALSSSTMSSCMRDDMRVALDAFNARAYAMLPSWLLPQAPLSPPVLDLLQLARVASGAVSQCELSSSRVYAHLAACIRRSPPPPPPFLPRLRRGGDGGGARDGGRVVGAATREATATTASRMLAAVRGVFVVLCVLLCAVRHHVAAVVSRARRRRRHSRQRPRQGANDDDENNDKSSNARVRGGRARLAWQQQQQQQQQHLTLCRRLAHVLSRFEPTQPVLFIYTSGTTGGLPKAARFSHLRFFATCYLSRLMHLRARTRWQVQQQQQQGRRRCCCTCPVYGEAACGCGGSGGGVNSGNGSGVHDVWHRLLAYCRHAPRTPPLLSQQQRDDDDDNDVLQRELSCLTVYNCLPMYHTVGCVFCLGHLMHALEEQQAAQPQRRWWRRLLSSSSSSSSSHTAVPTVRMVLRSRFSASCFRADMQRYHVTVVQYIGEILRYATLYERRRQEQQQQQPHSAQTQQDWCVPYAFGNGLRLDIWHECLARLRIAQPIEFYSSTEGSVFLFNLFNIPGAMGHMARFPWPLHRVLSFQHLVFFPFRVVRHDAVTQSVWRDAVTGYGTCVEVGEVGEVIGELVSGFDVFGLRRFDGYHAHAHARRRARAHNGECRRSSSSAAAAAAAAAHMSATAAGIDSNGSNRDETAGQDDVAVATGRDKVVRHVLWPFARRAYFRSGDLVRYDEYGFCTFVDRVGETFRWKGENVSTVEVSNVLQGVRGVRVAVQEAVVYGVAVDGCDGRAGMALLRLRDVCTTAPPSRRRERLFLQNELYALLCGVAVAGVRGGTDEANDARACDTQATRPTPPPSGVPLLPSYAVPLFVRVDDEDADVDGDCTAHTRATVQSTSATNDAQMTTTFKYRKYVLVQQGYDYNATDAQLRTAWGECDSSNSSSSDNDEHTNKNKQHGSNGGCNGDDCGGVRGSRARRRTAPRHDTAPHSRVYVLVRKPASWSQLVTQPAPTSCVGCYVPLTAEARRVLGGAALDKCGW